MSAPGAARYAGCLWWQALIGRARTEFPVAVINDLLDCDDASGLALTALRIGLRGVILLPGAPGRQAVDAIATGSGAILLASRPAALDMAARGAGRRLANWLRPAPPDDAGHG
jgi:hypothetical protein